jgi:hypothetical protein
MSNGVIVQYLGFQAKLQAREYSFNVREAGIERKFKLKIANEAFVTHHARYQDAPDICAHRLNTELAAHSNHPEETQFVISTAELDEYRDARAPKPRNSLYGRRKPQVNF